MSNQHDMDTYTKHIENPKISFEEYIDGFNPNPNPNPKPKVIHPKGLNSKGLNSKGLNLKRLKAPLSNFCDFLSMNSTNDVDALFVIPAVSGS